MQDAGRVAVVTFTDPRDTAYAEERERYLERRHREVRSTLETAGFTVVDPVEAARGRDWKGVFGLRSMAETRAAARLIVESGADALVVTCMHWTEPQLPQTLVRETNLPVCLYTEQDSTWAGSVNITATGASLWEVGVTPAALRHTRLMSDPGGLVAWARGVVALRRLRRSSTLLWGGSYCLRMEHLQDDIPMLKSLLVGDIITEDQYILVRGAERILAEEPSKVDAFIEWLQKGGVRITYDEAMLTKESLRRQVAMLLAARERLEQLEDEGIVAVSVKCQPELSEVYGTTACLLPSFLPFGAGPDGPVRAYPTVCEGDIKGMLTCAALALMQDEAPPLFGDLKFVGDDYIIISNCGGSSVWYAANSSDPRKVLPCVRLAGQCQGASGGAVGYDGQPGELTVARLVRVAGAYYMQLGVGRSLPITEDVTCNIRWGNMWPHVAIDLGVDPRLFIAAAGSNHYSAVPGDRTREVEAFCREAAVPIVRIDDDASLAAFVEEVAWG